MLIKAIKKNSFHTFTLVDNIEARLEIIFVNLVFPVAFNPTTIFSDFRTVTSLVYRAFSEQENISFGVKGYVTAKHSIFKISDLEIEYNSTIAGIMSESDDEDIYKCKVDKDSLIEKYKNDETK